MLKEAKGQAQAPIIGEENANWPTVMDQSAAKLSACEFSSLFAGKRSEKDVQITVAK